MQSRFLISIALVVSILTFSLSMADQIRYNMPFRTTFENLAPNTQKQVECLAQNIYFESGYESKEGQIAVAFVTLNRMNSGNYPDDICGVVKQKINGVCQFSWFCEANKSPSHLTNSRIPLYNDIKELATHVYVNYDKMSDPSKGALFYHADYVNPRWPNMRKTAVIGRHIFYNKAGKNI
jgi:spore germination cell wall hydrolase CwlJ-like protein